MFLLISLKLLSVTLILRRTEPIIITVRKPEIVRIIHLIPWKFAFFSTDGISGVMDLKCVLWFFVSCLWPYHSGLMAIFYGFNLWIAPDFIFWILTLLVIFL
jgi:hypothetical protein